VQGECEEEALLFGFGDFWGVLVAMFGTVHEGWGVVHVVKVYVSEGEEVKG
jgi:hypothetical protein